MAYLVKCPHCGRPKRIDVADYDPALKAYAYKFPDGAMYVGPGPTMYRCPECDGLYAVGTQAKDPEPAKQAGVRLADSTVWPWNGSGNLAT